MNLRSAARAGAVTFLAIYMAFAGGVPARANVQVLPRQFQDYAITATTGDFREVVKVNGARVAYADYFALKRDFAELRPMTEHTIDQLLLENFAYISLAHLGMGSLRNTAIPVDRGNRRSGFRPAGYGRADVLPFILNGKVIGLVDRKGAGAGPSGVKKNLEYADVVGFEGIQTWDHSDGLIAFGESLTETARQQARQRLYELEKTGIETVETYFVLEFPFSIRRGNGSLVRASVYGRQAHLGRNGVFQTPLPFSESAVDQQETFGAAIDQGRARIIDPRLVGTFGAMGPAVLDPQHRADWRWAHETAEHFSAGGDRVAVTQFLADMLRPLEAVGPRILPAPRPGTAAEISSYFNRYSKSSSVNQRRQAAQAFLHLVKSKSLTKESVALHAHSFFADPDVKVRMTVDTISSLFYPDKLLAARCEDLLNTRVIDAR